MKAITIALIVSLAVSFSAYCFTHQRNYAVYQNQDGPMEIVPKGNI